MLPPPSFPDNNRFQRLHSTSQLKGLKNPSQIICLGGNSPDAPTLGWIAIPKAGCSAVPRIAGSPWPARCAARAAHQHKSAELLQARLSFGPHNDVHHRNLKCWGWVLFTNSPSAFSGCYFPCLSNGSELLEPVLHLLHLHKYFTNAWRVLASPDFLDVQEWSLSLMLVFTQQ